MHKKIAVSLLLFALAVAYGATSYHVNLEKPAVLAGTELKAGDYKLEVNGNKAVIKNGKSTVEADVAVENNKTKFQRTSTCCLSDDGSKYQLQEIRVGGTTMKLTFKSPTDTATGGSK